ncbi:uncharacterized protein LACBIDRAFT_323655 [Laccaria bicolor S238N-H82]|uniref:Predicted protein n=1 Tax=Laccaria bicolor (strain S238N-H82 / ATCC MYA-4686) TaxID=486041 RepID=B0CYC9_LACBS|nr:uncharacterized protein LACBIDRAFT_323655 [Laccaria bicolor S238N-H82]EDR12866.1 predicted protein [Laccaria bicolor S238N-H82]|eukprot:XP_001877130.1 predicted protein [Laccaria bicolor S238N-H82]
MPPKRTSPQKKASQSLPIHLNHCINSQKRAILASIHHPQPLVEKEHDTNVLAAQQITSLLEGSVIRGEGNSCLLLGPRASGKSKLLDSCLEKLQTKPIVIRLSGWAQRNDRLALREIAIQLSQQTGTTFLSANDPTEEEIENEEDANPFLDQDPIQHATGSTAVLPPASHLPALISVIPTLAHPTVIILDAFDLFALHPRQSLLYCLLDTVQSCHAGQGRKGLAVIGVTSRVDTVQLLEKRVKSRFSGRTIRTGPPTTFTHWLGTVETLLLPHVRHDPDDDVDNQWKDAWAASIDRFLADKAVEEILNETFSITRDFRTLVRLLTALVVQLTPSNPFPLASQLQSAAMTQRARPRFPFLSSLSYPSMCLLIASVHSETAGHPLFTFEMLHDLFRAQVRSSTLAPVQINGGSIGMAFETLVTARIFICASPTSSNGAKGYLKYRSAVERDDVKKAVEKAGQVNMKKWLTKAQ